MKDTRTGRMTQVGIGGPCHIPRYTLDNVKLKYFKVSFANKIEFWKVSGGESPQWGISGLRILNSGVSWGVARITHGVYPLTGVLLTIPSQ